MKEKYYIITADKNDQDFLYEMLYQSIYVQPDSMKPNKKIIKNPELSKYVANWGKDGDFALIALNKNRIKIGAVWLRFFDTNCKGYGFISEYIPEIGIAVEEKSRGYGIGSLLLKELLKQTKGTIKSISLSVQSANPAMKFYKKFGFYECKKEGDTVIMRCDTST